MFVDCICRLALAMTQIRRTRRTVRVVRIAGINIAFTSQRHMNTSIFY